MNGPHDLGGRDGFGPVDPRPDESLFHAPWEARALALTLAAGALGGWSLDRSRAAREDRHPVEYLTTGYYGIWVKALERLLLESGLVTPDELATGRATTHTDGRLAPDSATVEAALARGTSAARDPGERRPRFAPGDRVRTLNLHPRGHTRLPAYARDKIGTVEAVRGHHLFADRSARGEDVAEWLYTVRFEGGTLWGGRAEPGTCVSIDAWEPYLTHA